jgi:hypothetical protein
VPALLGNLSPIGPSPSPIAAGQRTKARHGAVPDVQPWIAPHNLAQPLPTILIGTWLGSAALSGMNAL